MSFTVMLEPIGSGELINGYLCSTLTQPLSNALYEMTKVKPEDPLKWLANMLLMANINRPLIHEANPQIMQRLLDDGEAVNEDKNILVEVQAPCGCYLPKTDSKSPSASHIG